MNKIIAVLNFIFNNFPLSARWLDLHETVVKVIEGHFRGENVRDEAEKVRSELYEDLRQKDESRFPRSLEYVHEAVLYILLAVEGDVHAAPEKQMEFVRQCARIPEFCFFGKGANPHGLDCMYSHFLDCIENAVIEKSVENFHDYASAVMTQCSAEEASQLPTEYWEEEDLDWSQRIVLEYEDHFKNYVVHKVYPLFAKGVRFVQFGTSPCRALSHMVEEYEHATNIKLW